MAMTRVLISFPDDLLDQLDREAARQLLSRSELVRRAVASRYPPRNPERIEAAYWKLRESFARYPGVGDPAEEIRRAREGRASQD